MYKKMMELREKKKISGAEWERFSIKLDPFLSVIPVIKFSGSHSSSFTSQVFYGREERGDLRYSWRIELQFVEYGSHTRRKKKENILE